MAKQPRSLHGQVVAITGGARGIGLATARALARQGARVALGDLDAAGARAAAEDLGSGAIGLELNVTDRSSFEAFVDAVEQQLGSLDVLINNAGIMQIGRFLDEDDATAIRQIDINLHGVILGTKIALGRMLPRDRGTVVNIASQAGKFGAPGGATYSATKHAVVGLSEAVRGELRLEGSKVEIAYVMPAIVATELGSGLTATRGIKQLTPDEVADAIVESLQYGIVDVWVPKNAKSINKVVSLLPRTAAEGIGRALKADRALYDHDKGIRAGYELRASASEPQLDAAKAPAQLVAADAADKVAAAARDDDEDPGAA